MKKYLFILFSAGVFTATSSLLARTELSLNAGTTSAGGSMQLLTNILKDGGTSVGLSLAPSLSIFLARNFSLGINPSISKLNFSPSEPWHFSLKGGGTYYANFGDTLYPYLGASVGIKWRSGISGFDHYLLGVPFGMLIPLNRHVGIDFGVPLSFLFNNDGFIATMLPIGYLGVLAFF